VGCRRGFSDRRGVPDVLFSQAIAFIEHFRSALALHAPITGPDWLLISMLSFMVTVPGAGAVVMWKLYRRHWNRRLDMVWTQPGHKTQFGKVLPIQVRACAEERYRRMRYVSALLSTPGWGSRWEEMRKGGAIPPHFEPVTLLPDYYEAASAEILKAIEKNITERAIATGLIVGVSSNPRLDALTILLAAFEIQMYVLTELGKKPDLRLWIQLIKRCGDSLFFNTYLNRGDCLSVSFAIKQSGIGVQAVSELMDEFADVVDDVDMDEMSDMLPDYAKLVSCPP
jgi:hypothetical protein